jgi:maltokinase
MTPRPVAWWAAGLEGADLLPERHRAEGDGIEGPFTVVDTLHLGPRRWLALVADGAGREYPVPLAPGPDGELRRARAGDGVAEALLTHLADGRAGGFSLVGWHREPCAGERAIDVDQTNESVVVGERAVVKWTVRCADGPAPAASRIAALAEAGFEGMPRPWGMVLHGERLVATVAELLPGAVDGWEWAVADVGAHARGQLPLGEALAPAVELGTLTARMHRALPRRGRADEGLARRWRDRARAELDEALGLVGGDVGERFAGLADSVRDGLEPLARAAGTPLIDVHGDLHVGQVLRWRPAATGAGLPRYAVTDFDGNPVLPPVQRLEPQPAAADVAGLVQSLDHVARVVLRRVDGADPDRVADWSRRARDTLLVAYREELGDDGPLLDETLLRPFRIRQVVREHVYAARHLPRWSYVPDGALPALLADDLPA